MTTMRSVLWLGAALAACGDDGPGTDSPAHAAIDASPLRFAGRVRELDLGQPTAITGATISAFRTGEETAVAMTTSDGAGAYELALPPTAGVFDGRIRFQHAGQLDTVVFPSRPIAADTPDTLETDALMTTDRIIEVFAGYAQVSRQPGRGFGLVYVADTAGALLAGATVSCAPACTVRYTAMGVPSRTASATEANGLALVFNLPPGAVTISASRAGSTFRPALVLAGADEVLATVIR